MNAPKPEGVVPADIHYDEDEARRYHTSSRNIEIQRAMTERCLELLELTEEYPLILDVGCGSGLSSEVLDEHDLMYVGVDLSPAMLKIAREEEHVNGDFVRMDIGEVAGFQPGIFDAVISVSVIQWLCHSFTSEQDPKRRLRQFFQWLYSSMSKTGRAVLQFYPSHQQQVDMIGKAASIAGFTTFFLVDNAESSKKKKMFLILTIGQPDADSTIATALAAGGGGGGPKKGKKEETYKEWVVRKKEKQRKQGKEVKRDSAYTGRKRRDRL